MILHAPPFHSSSSPSDLALHIVHNRRAGYSWKEVVNAAYMDRVDLSAHGFYVTPDITGFGGNRPFNYFCFVSTRT
jgi:xanthine dehydrogenase molybdopterin-binding subunit B